MAFEPEQFESLRVALRHRVALEVAVEHYRYPYAAVPHDVRFSLQRVVDLLD